MNDRALLPGLLLALALLPLNVDAVGNRLGPAVRPPTLEKMAQDLTHHNPARRSYAGRVLLRQVKTARKEAAHGPEDDLTRATAMQALTDFDRLVAPVCSQHLAVPEITSPCAEILRYLQTRTALPMLKAQRKIETRSRVIKELDEAIAGLEEPPR
jgi:hypothetical protein